MNATTAIIATAFLRDVIVAARGEMTEQGRPMKFEHFIILAHGENGECSCICPVVRRGNKWQCSLNPVTTMTGTLKLSSFSLSIMDVEATTLKEAVAAYNAGRRDGEEIFGIRRIVDFFSI